MLVVSWAQGLSLESAVRAAALACSCLLVPLRSSMDGKFPAWTGELKMMSGATLHLGPLPRDQAAATARAQPQTVPAIPALPPCLAKQQTGAGDETPHWHSVPLWYDPCFSPLPQEAPTLYSSPRRSARRYRAKKCCQVWNSTDAKPS